MPNVKVQRCFCNILIIYAVIQVFLLTIYLKKKEGRNELDILETYRNLSKKLNEDAQVDNSGLFKIFLMKSSETKIAEDITIVSQCSSNHFLSVENLFKAWDGPISIAIYTEVKHILETLWDMARFIRCHNGRDFQMQLVVPFQDVYLRDYRFATELLSGRDFLISCSSPYNSAKNGTINYNWSYPYPINLLRNVAKQQASTNYIMVIDIDMIPNPGLRNDFFNLTKNFSSTSEKVVYVLPAFEIPFNFTPPVNKFELINLILTNKARPFYFEPCRACQRLSDYNNWLSSNTLHGVDLGRMLLTADITKQLEKEIKQKVQWVHPWEPFFIGGKEIPNFDERFKQYGMNRVSQICQLHVAGYDFVVLDNAFLIHNGFKTVEGFHETKNKEMNENRRIYNQFKTEIKYKYPESDRSC